MADPFNNLQVFVEPDGARMVHWEMNPNVPLPDPIEFRVDRARSGGDWERAGCHIVDDCFHEDDAEISIGKTRDLYYRVSYRFKGRRVYSEPVQTGAGTDNRHDWKIVREIIRKEYLDLIRYSGLEGKFMRRRHWGKKCPECLDFDTGEVARHHCDVCLGTGIVGGYFSPVQMYVKRVSKRKHSMDVSEAGAGTTQPIAFMAETVAFPWVNTGDLWIDSKTNDRHVVHDVGIAAEYRGIPLRWSMELRLLNREDVRYTEPATAVVESDPEPAGTDNNWRPDLTV